jgi:hypothetical protein
MVRYRFLRSAAIALGVYGVLGLTIAVAMLLVGVSTFERLTSLEKTLESERLSLVQSIHTVSSTLKDTSSATTNFQQSIDTARGTADTASKLANASAGTFRQMGLGLTAVTILGFQPLTGLSPQFDASADQLQSLAITLGSTRDALGQNANDVRRVGTDLDSLQAQLEAMATTLSQPGVLGLDVRDLLPFQVAFYGMCLLVTLQSVFSVVGGVTLFRLQRALGTQEALFPNIRRATTIDAAERGRVRAS